jgi:hypothetical protein
MSIYAGRLGNDVVKWANKITRWGSGMCQNFTRTAQDTGPGAGTAIAAWEAAGKEHQHSGHYPPPGVSVCWRSRTPGKPGHTAPSVGNGLCRSTDNPVAGRVQTVSIGALTEKWDMILLGWTSKNNGKITWRAPKTVLDCSEVRHALFQGGKIAHGRLLKREIGAQVGKGTMSYTTDTIGRSARKKAQRLNDKWPPAAGSTSVLSNSDLRRLGFCRNAFRVKS